MRSRASISQGRARLESEGIDRRSSSVQRLIREPVSTEAGAVTTDIPRSQSKRVTINSLATSLGKVTNCSEMSGFARRSRRRSWMVSRIALSLMPCPTTTVFVRLAIRGRQSGISNNSWRPKSSMAPLSRLDESPPLPKKQHFSILRATVLPFSLSGLNRLPPPEMPLSPAAFVNSFMIDLKPPVWMKPLRNELASRSICSAITSAERSEVGATDKISTAGRRKESITSIT
mmetsp:Transcript_28093/g.61662  ORF Transcript_28093/g.61662 Transcript_28093/m.61662 type:complete len:231 (+) Transcript_28093:3056-3748(+)